MGSSTTETEKLGKAPVAQRSAEQRRKHERFNFPVLQKICPCRGDVIPRPARFLTVKCKDLSRGGISFYLDFEPSFDRFILMLCNKDRTDYVLGEVIHLQELPADSPDRYLVGCRLIRKVKSAACASEEE